MRGLFPDKSEAEAFKLFILFNSSTGTLLLLWNMSRFQNKRRRNSSSIGVMPVKDQCRGGHLFFCYVYRCSSTCWHLKTPALAQIHHRTEKPKTNSLFNQLNTSGASWLSWKLCDFGSSGTRFEFHRGQLFISVSLFFSKWGQQKNSKSFTWTAMASAHARQWSL